MNEINKKSELSRNWWRKLVNTLIWDKNAGLPISEKYWQDLTDKIMSQIDVQKGTDKFTDKKVEKKIDNKVGAVQFSAEI